MDDKSFAAIGNYLKQKRVDADLTQSQVAEHLGLKSAQFVSNFERGLCGPSWAVLKQLVKIYNISSKDITNVLMEEQRKYIRRMLAKGA